MAKLHFKYGAMNSGKTDTLIKAAYNYTENNLRPVVVKAEIDTKGNNKIIARAGMSRAVDIMADPSTDIRKNVAELSKESPVHCVFIDEAQFLSEAQISQLYDIAKRDNISVVAYGLRTDFMTHMFPGAKRLFELADNIEKIPTMCRCGSQAEFNCRMIDGAFVFEGEQVAIDGEQEVTYVSLCASCRNKEMGDV